MDSQAGSAKAMEALVSRWQKRLWSYAYRMTHNKDAAWDITQETWLGIIKGLRKLQDPANFRAWAYKITTNKAIDWIKKRKANKHIGIEEVQDYKQKTLNDTVLKELLEKLDIRKRAVLSLHYLEQLTVPEVSVVLGIPKGTVKSRLHSARRELKKLWEKHLDS